MTMFNFFGIGVILSVLFSLNDCTGDPNGYIAYCPCMGRFGNQADHFLGALGFAKGVNRTLILPPWVEYKYGAPKSIQVPFNTYFQVEPLSKFHRVILMEEFMEKLAPTIWPKEQRISFCYTARGSSNGCNAKEGNPFGPFWDTFDVDFVSSQFYGPLHYDIHNYDMAFKWRKTYPPDLFPVMAFAGAPASFPVQLENRDLHRFLQWSDTIVNETEEFIRTNLPKGAFIGLHLRNGIDWVRACEHIKNSPSLFAAPQCLGYRGEGGRATHEMCLPDAQLVVRQVKKLAKKIDGLAAIVVAADSNHMLPELTKAFSKKNVKIVKAEGSSPHVELSILARANHLIANCISSFSAFVVRERSVKGLPSSFWGYPPFSQTKFSIDDENSVDHDEL